MKYPIHSSSLLQSQQSHEMTWGDIRDPLDRTDTLERNPRCVDPNLVTPKLEKHQVLTEYPQQQQQTQNHMAENAIEVPQFTTIVTPVNVNGQNNIWANGDQNQTANPIDRIVFGPEDLQLLTNPPVPGTNNQYQGPTSNNPCTTDYPSECGFKVTFETMCATSKNKYWDVSSFIFINYFICSNYNHLKQLSLFLEH